MNSVHRSFKTSRDLVLDAAIRARLMSAMRLTAARKQTSPKVRVGPHPDTKDVAAP
jgi:hypothetical protein